MTAAGVVLVVCDKQHNYLCVCQRGWGGACARQRRGWSRPLSPLSTVTGVSSLCRPHSSAGNEFYTETVTRDHREIMAEVIQRKSVIERIQSKAMLDTCYTCTLSVVLDAKMSLYSRLFVDKHNKVILLGNNRRNITQHSQRCQCVSRLYELLQNIDVEPLDKSGCASKKGWEHGQGGGGSDSVSTRRQLAVNKIIISSLQHCHVSS